MLLKKELLEILVSGGYLRTPLIKDALEAIDRKDFLPGALGEEAYINEPLPIGFGQTISQPLTVAFMLELLRPVPGERVLDIGAGSGWQTALLAYCVGGMSVERRILRLTLKKKEGVPRGTVLGVERIPKLKEMAEKNIDKYSFIKEGIARVVLGDGSEGAPREFVPPRGFDKIIAAAAGEEIPKAWKEQLKIGGRLVAPVGHSIFLLKKTSAETFNIEEHVGFSFVPLILG